MSTVDQWLINAVCKILYFHVLCFLVMIRNGDCHNVILADHKGLFSFCYHKLSYIDYQLSTLISFISFFGQKFLWNIQQNSKSQHHLHIFILNLINVDLLNLELPARANQIFRRLTFWIFWYFINSRPFAITYFIQAIVAYHQIVSKTDQIMLRQGDGRLLLSFHDGHFYVVS